MDRDCHRLIEATLLSKSFFLPKMKWNLAISYSTRPDNNNNGLSHYWTTCDSAGKRERWFQLNIKPCTCAKPRSHLLTNPVDFKLLALRWCKHLKFTYRLMQNQNTTKSGSINQRWNHKILLVAMHHLFLKLLSFLLLYQRSNLRFMLVVINL